MAREGDRHKKSHWSDKEFGYEKGGGQLPRLEPLQKAKTLIEEVKEPPPHSPGKQGNSLGKVKDTGERIKGEGISSNDPSVVYN